VWYGLHVQTHSRRSSRSAALTAAEWLGLPDDVRGELVDGRLEEEEVPSDAHEVLVIWLGAVLARWAERRGGFVFGSERKLLIGSRRGRKPDLTLLLGDDPAPRIVVEIITPTPRDARRDRVEKPDDYAKVGARFYWLVDPVMRTLEIFELGPRKRYERALSAASGKVRVPGCRGLVLDLDAAWLHLDKLERRARRLRKS